MLPHGSDLWSVHWLALPEEPSDQRSPSARQASCDSFEPTRRAPEVKPLQHWESSEWIAGERFWMNGNAVAWLKWA
jgi:hypothetical protein